MPCVYFFCLPLGKKLYKIYKWFFYHNNTVTILNKERLYAYDPVLSEHIKILYGK